MRRRLVIHPFLFSAYAILALLAANITQIGFSVLRSLIYTLLFALLVLIILFLILRDSVKAGLLASGIMIAISSYGHVESLITDLLGYQQTNGYLLALLPLVILLALWVLWVLKKLQTPLPLNNYLNWVSLILIAFPIYQIWGYERQMSALGPWEGRSLESLWQSNGVADIRADERKSLEKDRPDIYYLILDAYTRADILQHIYDYDSSEFTSFLKARGFYIADASRSNYAHTELSIASSLNMLDLSMLPGFLYRNAGVSDEATLRKISTQLIQESRLASFLQQQGYSYVVFDSGFGPTRVQSADQYLSLGKRSDVSGNQLLFDMIFLDTTAGRVYMSMRGKEYAPLQALFDEHRDRILYTLDHLPDFASKEGAYFVFAHVVSPHVPYVFGPDGEPIRGEDPYTLLDNHPGQQQNVSLYAGQVHYLNKLLMESIDKILANSESPPIIIIQGDHSSKVFSGPEPDPETRMKLLFPILNAYLLPAGGAKSLYPTITPVNSFRIVLNQYFGTKLERMPDRSYLLESQKGRDVFVDICNSYPQMCVQQPR
jgi:hypothetical protein